MNVFIGIDISERRGCSIAAIDQSGRSLGCRWSTSEVDDVVGSVRLLTRDGTGIDIGIDSPRRPADVGRKWYWDRRTLGWRPRLPGEQGWGRHCEVVVSVMKLANPQWTPPEAAAPGWMRLGFSLFAALEGLGEVHEVFPTASYAQLAESAEARLEMSFYGSAKGRKDVLDAYIGALTVLEYKIGNGFAVGGGDDLGTIVLPRPVLNAPADLCVWPSTSHAV